MSTVITLIADNIYKTDLTESDSSAMLTHMPQDTVHKTPKDDFSPYRGLMPC